MREPAGAGDASARGDEAELPGAVRIADDVDHRSGGEHDIDGRTADHHHVANHHLDIDDDGADHDDDGADHDDNGAVGLDHRVQHR